MCICICIHICILGSSLVLGGDAGDHADDPVPLRLLRAGARPSEQ